MEATQRKKVTLSRVLSEKQYAEITECLSSLAQKLRITSVILVDSTGRVVSEKASQTGKIDTTLLSTLAANAYAAAREMARILGEKDNFKMVLHEGEKYNTFIAHAGGDFFLVIIFEPGVAMGMVRLFTKKTIARLAPIFAVQSDDSAEMNRVFDDRFESLLDEELDRTLKERF